MNPENRWVKKAAIIPWEAIEEKYAELFPGDTGYASKAAPYGMIQKQYEYSNRELLEKIKENPYYQ